MGDLLKKHIVNGYIIDVFSVDAAGTITYCAPADCKQRRAVIRYCEPFKRLRGNVPAGTQYGSYRIITPDGKRGTLRVYI